MTKRLSYDATQMLTAAINETINVMDEKDLSVVARTEVITYVMREVLNKYGYLNKETNDSLKFANNFAKFVDSLSSL